MIRLDAFAAVSARALLSSFLISAVAAQTSGGYLQQAMLAVSKPSSIVLSAGGNTLIVGSGDNATTAIFTRANGTSTWSQQGNTLGGSGDPFGAAVALSADGNTAVVSRGLGGQIFTRSNGAWTEQGSVLVGTGAQGYGSLFDLSMSVSLSACPQTCYSETVKNITVSLPDELYRRARIRAAEQDTSVSAVVQQRFLIAYTQEETDFERRKRLQREVVSMVRDFSAGDRLDRDALHERSSS